MPTPVAPQYQGTTVPIPGTPSRLRVLASYEMLIDMPDLMFLSLPRANFDKSRIFDLLISYRGVKFKSHTRIINLLVPL